MEGGTEGKLRGNTRESRLSRRQKLVLAAVGAVMLIVLIIGLGLGLGLRNRGGGGDEPETTQPPAPQPTAVWQPAVNTSWQIILNAKLDIDPDRPAVVPDVEVYDIDMFMHQNSRVISSLHKLNKKVICYFSAGSYEPNRPDSDKFPDADMGSVMEGWPDEKWINISSPAIREIMVGRLDIASRMGCDGVDPDNVDGFQNKNGLDLKPEHSVSFMNFLADEAHNRKMAIGLKNAGDIVKTMLPKMEFAVNEECAEFKACPIFSPFIKAGKPVFHIEYPDGAPFDTDGDQKDEYCSAPGAEGFSTILKAMNLNFGAEYCDGSTVRTKVLP
ncbi:glycoside hydrolase superfamily [Triangularia verruculosa]|uniref:alpha-galactosidase n=1 Tax=Triangularia verruculosa TaxID=2587418 RepID=A0AAN7AXB0_9PEZI|nr:glycoside hydrolase superfamily [Triangularia verruculosa]